MSARELKRRLSPEDAAFLLMDTDASPQNIGSIAIFEGNIDYARFVDNIASKLHLIPRYRQRVVNSPLNLGRATWEDDPEFDIAWHVREMDIDRPGTDAQLVTLATRLYDGRLDRNRPLWEMTLVHGLSGGRTGVVSKVHHCLVDGVGGVEMLLVVLDVSQNPAPPPPAEAPFEPRRIPSRASLAVDAMFDSWEERVERWAGLQRGLVDVLLGGDSESLRTMGRGLRRALPYFAVPVQRAFFNGEFSPKRQVAATSFPFEQVRAVRKASTGTVNDVVLTVLSLALREYLRRHGEAVDRREFRVLLPVNVRPEDASGQWGNHISMILVELPLYKADPLEVLRTIAERTEKLKTEHAADGIAMIAQGLLGLPAPMLGALGMMPPPKNNVANMVCTNVPGPMIPLYTVGHRLLEHYALAPLGWEMGMGVAVTSYNQRLYVTTQSDAALADDMDDLRDLLDEAYQALCAEAGVDVRVEAIPEIQAPRSVVAA
ncbi:MAG TPA: wax ester/triacylglycerol synthase family O-acyltransferase [Dehalococcoidia bacterium]|nr:wax ester/triacylglycerol synthase family O-acyltransferase [Dehalococcoidia bacterium]